MKKSRSLGLALTTLALVTVPSVAVAQVGTLDRSQRISEGEGGFTGTLAPQSSFGASAVALGDVDGDGVPDLAVGNRGDGDGGPYRGAVWILFMTPSGTVGGQTKISQTQGGFTDTLPDSAQFGRRLAAVGDLDDDGVPDLAVGTGTCPGTLRPRMWILFLNSDGTVREHTETVFHLEPAFVPTPVGCDFVGGGLAPLGDVDGDGVEDLAIGAPYDDDGPGANRGAFWIARMNPDGTVKSTQKISQVAGGLTSELTVEGNFGGLISNLGDRDGDGNVEIGVTASSFQPYRILFLDGLQQVRDEAAIGINEIFSVFGPGGISLSQVGIGDVDGDGSIDLGVGRSGGVGVMFVSPDGRLRKALEISDESIGFLPQAFPSLLGPAGDLDGDGTQELIAGDPGTGPGAIFILFTRVDPIRNGSDVNALTLKAGDTVLGETWGTRLDCSGNAAGLALVSGWTEPREGIFLPAGELLVGGQRLFVRSAVHAGEVLDFLEDLPDDPALVGLPLSVQGLCTGSPGPQLSNALDFLLGF